MADALEPMQRITLTFTFDQVLLEVEGKSDKSGRLFNADFRRGDAADFLVAIQKRLATSIRSGATVDLKVNRDDFTILLEQ